MKRYTAQVIVEILATNDVEAEVYPDYSGRYMYGAETHGVNVIDEDVTVEDVQGILLDNTDLIDGRFNMTVPDLADYQLDSLGMGMIIY